MGAFIPHEEMPNSMNTICSNCGKLGHLFYQCKLPITSYGIILFRMNSELEYLMIRRKDSFGYIDFIRGKYSLNNICQIQKCVDEMSMQEKSRIIQMSFDDLWRDLWGKNSAPMYKSEETSSSKKFDALRTGVQTNDTTTVTLEDIVKRSPTNWEEQEWEFPKGRRNQKENDMECALREFEEETGLKRDTIELIENVIPYEEYFIGSNFKAYKHKFYLAYTKHVNHEVGTYQRSEVSKMKWMNIADCLHVIRPYNLEKKNILGNINKMLKRYSFYS